MRRQQIWVQRSLIEHVAAKPVAGGQAERPVVIAPAVAYEKRTKRCVTQRHDVSETKRQGTAGDSRKPPPATRLRSNRSGWPSLVDCADAST